MSKTIIVGEVAKAHILERLEKDDFSIVLHKYNKPLILQANSWTLEVGVSQYYMLDSEEIEFCLNMDVTMHSLKDGVYYVMSEPTWWPERMESVKEIVKKIKEKM